MEQQSDITTLKECGVTVGTFDGVHRGHREVVEFLVAESRRRGLRPLVITFDPHPLAVIAPQRAPQLLEHTSERVDALRSLGADVVVLKFTEELRRHTAAQWLRRLASEFNAKMVVAGFDNTFGSDGRDMTFADYARIGASQGLEIIEAPRLPDVSSTLIRHALLEGDVAKAATMLGHPYAITGIVTHGRELGRTIGTPTANLLPDTKLLIPTPGVYAADAVTDGTRNRSVVNIGVAPTVGTGLPLTIEAHLLDFSGNLYDSELRLEFLKRLRPERRFESLGELKTQIAADILSARNL